MRQRALACVVLVVGCGDDLRGSPTFHQSDAAVEQVDAAPPDAAIACPELDPSAGDGIDECNPVSQQGCEAGEKCTWLETGTTGCAPDGDVAIGEPCTDSGASDDCAAGGLCLDQLCRTICSVESDSCCTGFACSLYSQTFSDDPTENTGVCDATCDPIAQDCANDNHGCYLSLRSGKATCATIAGGSDMPPSQGEECANEANVCFLNGCAEGYGAFLFTGEGIPRQCTAFCSPVDTYLDDPDGDGEGTLIGTPTGDAEIADCTGERVGNMTDLQCRFFQSFFVDMNSNFLEYVPEAYGFCTPSTADTFGDCRFFSEEWFFAQYNDYIENDGGTPEGWGEELTTLCDMKPGGCPSGCARLATLDTLIATYCEANAETPACQAGARGARIVLRSLERTWAERMIRAGLFTDSR